MLRLIALAFLLTNQLFASNESPAELNDNFFKSTQATYCENNPYNCLFDGSVSRYSANDYIKFRYFFIDKYFYSIGFESAIFELCRAYYAYSPSRYNPVPLKYGQCLSPKILASDAELDEYGDVELVALPKLRITEIFPKDRHWFTAIGGETGGMGVYFFIDLDDMDKYDKYCSSSYKGGIKVISKIARMKKENPDLLFSELMQPLEKDYIAKYRVYLRDMLVFLPSNVPNLEADCLIQRKNDKRNRAMIFHGKPKDNSKIVLKVEETV